MDAGIGAFIVSSALTSRYARHGPARTNVSGSCGRALAPQSPSKPRSSSGGGGIQPMLSNAIAWVQTRCPLRYVVVLSLGVGRMFVIKLLDYDEHSSEYGKKEDHRFNET